MEGRRHCKGDVGSLATGLTIQMKLMPFLNLKHNGANAYCQVKARRETNTRPAFVCGCLVCLLHQILYPIFKSSSQTLLHLKKCQLESIEVAGNIRGLTYPPPFREWKVIYSQVNTETDLKTRCKIHFFLSTSQITSECSDFTSHSLDYHWVFFSW